MSSCLLAFGAKNDWFDFTNIGRTLPIHLATEASGYGPDPSLEHHNRYIFALKPSNNDMDTTIF
eukprot:scaffold1525_cov142-Cylindrotheca_fusiformis.AAC.8